VPKATTTGVLEGRDCIIAASTVYSRRLTFSEAWVDGFPFLGRRWKRARAVWAIIEGDIASEMGCGFEVAGFNIVD
jgi:hypothetical protein